MVSSNYQTRFFRKDHEGDWHLYREDKPVSLCKREQLAYNVDPISDILPMDAHLCADCAAVRDGKPTGPEIVHVVHTKPAAKPATSKRTAQRKRAKTAKKA